MESDFSDYFGKVLRCRRRAWDDICNLLGRRESKNGTLIAEHTSRICLLASSSRGGTSVTAELLQWQGAECNDPSGRLLTLPGEEKPHLILAELGFPARRECFDDLTEKDAKEELAARLCCEIASEIGYPMAWCDNLWLYATQLYRRLLLQWPTDLTKLEMKEAIARLAQSLQVVFPGGYRDSPRNRRQVLAACVRCFPFIRPSFYDCWPVRAAEDVALLAGGPWSIEETPFVLPPPWHNATPQDLDQGCLLLRDPSNAWRLGFWRAIFPSQRIDILHLIRDPRESVQGLCDGWSYSFGFQTMPCNRALTIHGYTDNPSLQKSDWKHNRLNFSIDRNLSQIFLDRHKDISLVQICGHQWREAHASILAETERLELRRTVVNFSQLRESTEKTFRRICTDLNLECSQSGLAYVRSFADRWIMATALANRADPERWKRSAYSAQIGALVLSGYFDEVSMKLGMGRISSVEVDDVLSDDTTIYAAAENFVRAPCKCSGQPSLSYA